MFNFKNQPENLPFLHDKLFTLEWNLKGYKWILIHFVNGQKKRWYHRTERPYRFHRWFLRKPKGDFSNLANYDYPKIEIYLFAWYLAWPRKVVIPMKVNRLVTQDFSFHTDTPNPKYVPFSLECNQRKPDINLASIAVATNDTGLLSPAINLIPLQLSCSIECDWPIANWMEQGLVNERILTYEYLQKLKKLPNHA